MAKQDDMVNRKTPIEIDKEEFKAIGYDLINAIADFLHAIDERPVTTNASPGELRDLLPQVSLPEKGCSPSLLLSVTTDLLMKHSLLNGHPKFFGYITSSAAPLGALGDMLASAV